MRKPTPEDHARRMKAFREANKRWPLPVSGMGLPPKAWLIDWYFANRLRGDFAIGFTASQIAANDRLWNYICQHDATPSADWLAANNAEATEKNPAKGPG